MDILKSMNLVKDRIFKVGDLVEIIEVTNDDPHHRKTCYRKGIVPGTIMRVATVKEKDPVYCNEVDRIICDQVCNKCVSVAKLDNEKDKTFNCYTKFRRIKRESDKE